VAKGTPGVKPTFMGTAKELLAEHGVRGFARGIMPRMLNTVRSFAPTRASPVDIPSEMLSIRGIFFFLDSGRVLCRRCGVPPWCPCTSSSNA
jgi:hypothetical protein